MECVFQLSLLNGPLGRHVCPLGKNVSWVFILENVPPRVMNTTIKSHSRNTQETAISPELPLSKFCAFMCLDIKRQQWPMKVHETGTM